MPLSSIAETGDRFASFGPYVPSVNGAGLVAFQFVAVDGRTGVCTVEGPRVTEHPLGDPVAAVTSHPDVTGSGALSFYGEAPSGEDRVFLVRDGVVRAVGERFHAIGPAGPTMNEACEVAFRAEREPGIAGIHVAAATGVRTVAETGERFAEFHGLPLIDARGAVAFRADTTDGVQGIYLAAQGAIRPIVESGDAFSTIAPFPSRGLDGSTAFAATTAHGGHGIFTVRGGVVSRADDGEGFASHWGALLAGDVLVRIATPHGGGLGLFRGPDPARDRIVAVGDPCMGSTVENLAANPVSVNGGGQLVIRLGLADGRGAIVRADLD